MAVIRQLLFYLFFLVPIIGFSQENILKRKITFTAKNQTLENTLLSIANVGDFSFSYNPQVIAGDSIVSIDISNSSVKDVLDVIFQESIIYKVSGNHLILLREKPAKTKENNKFLVSGYVIDASSGQRLASTTIYEVYTLTSTISDEQGYYTLNLTQKYDEFGLAYSKREFMDTLVLVQPKDHTIDIQLHPKKTQPELAKKTPKFEASIKPLDSVSVVQKFIPNDQFIRSENIEVIERRPAQISLIPKIGSNTKMSGSIENHVSINIFAGYSAGVKGFELGGFMNISKRHVTGFQAAGLSNIVGGRTKGLQIAGISNNNRGSLIGFQAAGISNMVVDTIKGVQLAGISNILQGGMKGWQLAGISNVTTKNVNGVQFAGISNFAKGDVDLMQISGIVNYGKNVGGVQFTGIVNTSAGKVGGAQISGIANYAKEVNVLQFSGIMNIATQRVRGAQIAGIVNYGKEIKGSQFALFNISDTVSGLPIGLISIVRRGYRRVEFSANEVLYANLTFKMGVRKFYNIFTGGLLPEKTIKTWGFGYGFGFENSIGRKFLQNFDLTSTWILEEGKPFGMLNLLTKIDINYAYLLGKRTSMFFGPSINFHISEWVDTDSGEFLTKIAPYSIYDIVFGDTQMQIWVGGKFGFRF